MTPTLLIAVDAKTPPEDSGRYCCICKRYNNETMMICGYIDNHWIAPIGFKVVSYFHHATEAELLEMMNEQANIDTGPLVVHQKLCAKLVDVCKNHPNQVPQSIPEASKILDAIDVLEESYPNLRS